MGGLSLLYPHYCISRRYQTIPNLSLSCFQVSFTGCFAALELHHGHEARARAFLHAIPQRWRGHGTGVLQKYPKSSRLERNIFHMKLRNVAEPLDCGKTVHNDLRNLHLCLPQLGQVFLNIVGYFNLPNIAPSVSSAAGSGSWMLPADGSSRCCKLSTGRTSYIYVIIGV